MLVVSNKADRPEFQKLEEVEMNISAITGEGIEEVVERLVVMIEEKRLQSLEESEEELEEESDEESIL